MAAGQAVINLAISGYISPDGGAITFNPGGTISVVREDLHNAAVVKYGAYDKAAHTMTYQVVVTSEGTTQDISLDDVMGDALLYSGDCHVSQHTFTETDAHGSPVTRNAAESENRAIISREGNNIHIEIGSTADGEIYEFTYTAAVELDHITKSGGATFDEMGNTVTLVGDANPVDNGAVHYEKDIEFSDLIKTVSQPGAARYSSEYLAYYKTVTWTITTNEDGVFNFAGTTISDMLPGDPMESDPSVLKSDAILYAGTGVQVEIWRVTGKGDERTETLVDTRDVPWSEVGVGNVYTDKAFEYHIPDDDLPYKYVLRYDTDILLPYIQGTEVFDNLARGKGGEDVASLILRPEGEGGLSVRKSYVTHTTISTASSRSPISCARAARRSTRRATARPCGSKTSNPTSPRPTPPT